MTSPRETPPPAPEPERPAGAEAPTTTTPAPPETSSERASERAAGETAPAARVAGETAVPAARPPGGYLGPVERPQAAGPAATHAPPAAAVPRAGAAPAPKDAGGGSKEPASAAPAPAPKDSGPNWAPGSRGDQEDAQRTTVLPGGAGAARASHPVPARPAGRPEARADARPSAARPPAPRTRRARLALRRIDPWSVFVFSLVASVFLGVALVVAVAVLYAVLGSLGVTDSVNQLFAEVTGGSAAGEPLLTSGRIVGGAAILAAVNVVLLTLLATLGALLYNLCASFTGGLELTLGERD